MSEEMLAVFLGSSLRLAVPLLFAATGETVSERAGVLNISLEGIMLSAAFAAAAGSWAAGSPAIGLLLGLAVATLVGLAQAFLSVTLRANQIVVGLGINILALGATTLLSRELLGTRSQVDIPGFAHWHIPLLSDLPLVGPAFFRQVGLTYLALLLVPLTWWLLRHTPLGLAVDAVGSDPRAADKTGLSVTRVRYGAVVYASLLAGFGGMFLSIGDIHTFTEGMTSGAGYLALAAVIFGNWDVWRTFVACLLFGAATALQFQLPAMGIAVPVALLVMMPYVLALLAVAGVVGRQTPPAALTLPFRRGA
jgi:general nucleoside transport system permease protein